MKTIMFPGQGSQYKGMGKDLFKIFTKETQLASEILGYDIVELCVEDPKKQLGKTNFTQPALYVVNAFGYMKQYGSTNPDYLIGHSLGEYNALLAAGAFDFETGLRLVQKRGELMAAASGGGMAAVLGLETDALKAKLKEPKYAGIDVANFNTPTQIVIAGKQADIDTIFNDFSDEGIKIIPLFVSAPFHSRYMKPAADEFAGFLDQFSFSPLKTPVISNVTARPYENDRIKQLLSTQIDSSVQWVDTVRFLMGKNVSEFEEVGSAILTKMVSSIKETCSPIVEAAPVKEPAPAPVTPTNGVAVEGKSGLSTKLGSHEFKKDYGIKYTYLAGAMYRGIASKELVVKMGKAGMLGFLGTGGMSLTQIEENIKHIQSSLTGGEAYGMNLLHNLHDSNFEMETAKLFVQYGVKNIEASAFMQITPALVYYRLKGLAKAADGSVVCNNKILAKVSRPEVAEAFMRPAPERLVKRLLDDGLVTQEQAELAKKVPVSYDICVEADSGGHTNRGVAFVLLPSIQRLRKDLSAEYSFPKPIRVGLAGGIGTPQAASCAYMMGADFILTGSINQCTVEAGTSDAVKDLLQAINVQDTDYAPAGDMFEIGAKVQVLKKGVLFPVRANKLYELYKQYNSLEELPEKTVKQLEKNYFKKTIQEVWEDTKKYFSNNGMQAELTKAEANPKAKMGLVFRWYFGYSNKLAFDGAMENKVDFQVHTGPALGAFNQWVKGTELENWRNRNVDAIGIKMMEETALLMEDSLSLVND